MANAAFMKNYKLSAKGILVVEDEVVGIENLDTGEIVDFKDLLSDFADKSIKLSVSYDEEYGADEDEE